MTTTYYEMSDDCPFTFAIVTNYDFVMNSYYCQGICISHGKIVRELPSVRMIPHMSSRYMPDRTTVEHMTEKYLMNEVPEDIFNMIKF